MTEELKNINRLVLKAIEEETNRIALKYKLDYERVYRILVKTSIIVAPYSVLTVLKQSGSQKDIELSITRSLILFGLDEDSIPESKDDEIKVISPYFEDALKHLSPERALHFFENEDPKIIREKCLISNLLSHREAPLFSLEELENLMRDFISYQLENKDHLIRVGVPKSEFEQLGWISSSINRLYPVKDLTSYLLNRDRNDESNNQYISYEEIPFIQGLSPTDAERIVEGRRNIFELKVNVLGVLLDCVRNRDATNLWENCLKVFSKKLTHDEADFFFRIDRFFTSYDFWSDEEDLEEPTYFHCGGLTDLLEVIHHFEVEIIIGRLVQTRELLIDFIEIDRDGKPHLSIDSYFQIIDHPKKSKFDRALERFSLLLELELRFSNEFRERVKRDFERELSVEVVFRTHIRGLQAANYYREIMERHLEQKKEDLEKFDSLGASIYQQYLFRKKGDYWEVAFEGKIQNISHTKGMQLISYLLQNPGKEFHVMNLVAFLEDHQIDSTGTIIKSMHEEELENQDLSISGLGDGGEAIDPEAKKAYRLELEKLEDAYEIAIDTGNDQRAKEIADKIELIKRELARSVGKGGKIRKDASQKERARQNIYRLISSAKQNIHEYNPDLWKHLDNSINTGEFCSYNPERNIDWIFS